MSILKEVLTARGSGKQNTYVNAENIKGLPTLLKLLGLRASLSQDCLAWFDPQGPVAL